MRVYEGERVICSLVSYTRPIGIKAILKTLPYKLNADVKNEIYKDYMASGVKMLTQTLATALGGASLSVEYSDVIKGIGRKEDEKTGDEVVDDVLGLICERSDYESI